MSVEPRICEQPATDDELVVRAQFFDRPAFSLLYDRYYPRVARYCLRRLFDRSLAEDVVSEVFLQAAAHIRAFTGQTETDFRRWLFRIATNAVNAHLRQSRRRQELWEAAARSRHWDHIGGSPPSPADSTAVTVVAPGQQSPAQAFNKLAEAVVTAKTARFQMEVTYEGQPKQKFKAWFQAPWKFRQEIGDVINITDLSAGKIVSLATAQKMATVMNIQGAPKDKLARNEFERLRELLSGQRDAKAEHFERLEEKVIDGKRAVGFRLDSPDATVTLWGDPATGLPVRIESVSRGIVRTEVLMTDFEINVELPESLFDLTPPAGFKGSIVDLRCFPDA